MQAAVLSSQAMLAALHGKINLYSRAFSNLQQTRIYAPWQGTVSRINIRQGDYVNSEILNPTNDDTATATFPITMIDNAAFEVAVEVPVALTNKRTATSRPP